MGCVGARISTIIKAISVGLDKVSGALIIVMMLTILTEVVGRTFLGFSTKISYNLVGLLLGPVVLLGLAESFRRGAHIRMQVVTRLLPRIARDILDGVVFLITLVYAGFIFQYSLALATYSLQGKAHTWTVIELPLFPFQMAVAVGVFIFIIIMLLCPSASRSRYKEDDKSSNNLRDNE